MKESVKPEKNNKLRNASYWLMISLLALIFIPSGVMKLVPNEKITENFTKWGMLDYKEVIGICEMIFALLMFIPKTRLIGLFALTGIMGGAIYTHHQFQEPFFFPAAIIIVMWITHFVIRPKH